MADTTVDDYGLIIEGAVETLPSSLKGLKYKESKEDVVLTLKYLSECCAMGMCKGVV